MLEEDELAVRLEDPSDTLNGFHHAGNRAQRKGAHNCINACIGQKNTLSRQIEKLDMQLRSAPLLFCSPKHPWIGFQCGSLWGFLSCSAVADRFGLWGDYGTAQCVVEQLRPIRGLYG